MDLSAFGGTVRHALLPKPLRFSAEPDFRYEALQIEAVSSGRKNAAVEMKWADLLYIDIPQELYDQLLLQKEACQNILEGKDRRIREFLTELRNKDEE